MKFTLRELVFAVVASGALMGWLVERPYMIARHKNREAALQAELEQSRPRNVFIGQSAGSSFIGHQLGLPIQENVFLGYRVSNPPQVFIDGKWTVVEP